MVGIVPGGMSRFRYRIAFAGLVLGMALAAHAASVPLPPPAQGRVAQVDAIRTKDHARFTELLAALHTDVADLDAGEKRYLRYLDGWEANYEGRYPEAEAAFRAVMSESDDDALGVRATAMLMNNLTSRGKYAEAYAMAPRAAETLETVSDPEAKFSLLANLAQMLTFAGEPAMGLKYANMMIEATPVGRSPCQALVQKVTALEGARQLTADSPELQTTIDACTADRQPIFANTAALIRVDRLIADRKAGQALAALQAIAPAIEASGYFPHLIDLASQRAQIYELLGNIDEARKAANETVSLNHPGDINEALRIAYRVLYGIEKAQGNTARALEYYEDYVVQDQGYLRDANVRNAAYEAATQHFRAEKLESEGLSKENRILRLQQALDANAVETSRLYIAMLALVLLSILFWTARIKRSQLRFKWLSSRDSLTAVYNHQTFMAESDLALKGLERRAGDACLVFLDLDHFKQVNDTHGHAVGDAVLRHCVAICKGVLRKDDLLGRLGGEEFAMLLLDAPRLQGGVVAERLRTALSASPLVVEGAVVSVTASIGVACVDTAGYDLQRMCRAADAALYVAKHEGRDRVVMDGRAPVTPAYPAMGTNPRRA